MGFLDRFFLLIYSLAVFVLSIGILILCTQLVSFDFVWTNFIYLSGRWETAVVAMVVALISLRLLRVSIKFDKMPRVHKEAIVVHGNIGDVQVAVDAVKNLIDKMARSIKGVRDVKVQVHVKMVDAIEKMSITIKLVLSQENNVIETSDMVRETVKGSLNQIVGLTDFDLEVIVDDISNAPVQKQRVV